MSLAQGRSARQIAPNSKQQALAKLANLKQAGLKRTDQFQVRLPPPRARSLAARPTQRALTLSFYFARRSSSPRRPSRRRTSTTTSMRTSTRSS